MKGPVTKRLLFGLGLGALFSSCQPAQYHARDEGLTALQRVFKTPPSNDAGRTYISLRKEYKFETMIIEDDAPSSLPSFPLAPSLPSFPLASSLPSLSSAATPTPYASLTAKDYAFKQPEPRPSSQPHSSLDSLFSFPFQPLYSTPLRIDEHYLLSERRQRTLDNAFFPSYHDQERFALEEGWFILDSKLRDNRDKDLDERSMPLGKLGHVLRKILEKSNNSFGQVLRGFSGIADGPTQSLFGDDWKTKFNLRVGAKKTGIYLTLKESDALKVTVGYETSANIGGKEGDAAFYLTFEYPLGSGKKSH